MPPTDTAELELAKLEHAHELELADDLLRAQRVERIRSGTVTRHPSVAAVLRRLSAPLQGAKPKAAGAASAKPVPRQTKKQRREARRKKE